MKKIIPNGISRRRLLAGVGAGAGMWALSSPSRLLAAETPLTPHKGGMLRAAFNGKSGAPLDVLSSTQSVLAYVRARLVWDSLAEIHQGKLHYYLLRSAEADKTASRWHLKLREGITFSDGTPLTSKEVLFSLQTFASNPTVQGNVLDPVDFNACRIDDKYSLTLQLKQPVGSFDLRLATAMFIFPPHNMQIGSGGWLLQRCNEHFCSLQPRHDYWNSEQQSLLDEIRLFGIDDMTARVNGLKAGQFDYIGSVPLIHAISERNNPAIKTTVADKSEWSDLGFIMNIRQPPFNQPEVVQALKLSIDRAAMVKTLTYSMGEIANDLWGGGQIWFNNQLTVPPYDPDQARALLKRAGISSVHSTLRTSNYEWGMVESATLLLRQAKPSGFNFTINKISPSDYYADLSTLIDAPLKNMKINTMLLPVSLPVLYGRQASYPFSGVDSPQLEQLLHTLQLAQGDAITPAVQDVQGWLYQHGGDAFFARVPSLSLSSPRLHGIQSAGSFDYPQLRAAWLA